MQRQEEVQCKSRRHGPTEWSLTARPPNHGAQKVLFTIAVYTNDWCFLNQVLECNNIVQAINILEGLIPGEDAPKQADSSHLEKLFVFSLMWSVGALLELDDRKKVQLKSTLSIRVLAN